MKNKYIIGGFVAALMAPAFSACSDDFLDEAPQTNISSVTVASSEEGATAAVTGLARQMQRQFSDLKNGNLNASGETFFANLYGEGLGPDANIGEVTYYMASGIKPANFRYITGWWPSWMYKYAYSIIGSANSILHNLSEEPTNSNELWLKGSALAMRAHAYTRLMQVYAPRWQDSDNGQKYCIVLRLDAGEPNDKPFNTCNEVYDQIYKDLDEAIRCFEKTQKSRGDQLFFVDENVTRGLYARVALLKNDYKTAQKMAHDARQNYPIMSGAQYLDGFTTVNKEWMWAPAQDPLGIYYWGFGPHYACNGHYVKSWGYSCSMQPDLYRQIKSTDVRSQLYFGPNCVEHAPDLAKEAGVTAEDFNDASIYAPQTSTVSLTGSGTKPKGKNLAMWNFMKAYGVMLNQTKNRPVDPKGIYVTNTKGLAFGTQFKFQGTDDGYTSCWPPYMRGSEMLLIEAEAACQNGDNSTAVACLKELMAKRDPSYTVPATSGQALLAEVKLQRRIELWGEGFNWFDYKRWNEVIEYKTFNKNVNNMGTYPTTVAATYQPDYMDGWRAAIPQQEFTYNKEADPALVGL